MSPKSKSLFYQQLGILLKAGITPLGALEDMRRRGSAVGGSVVPRLLPGVAAGEPLSDQLAKLPVTFSALEITAVRAGERSGRLPETLAQLARHFDILLRNHRRLVTGMIYPAMLLHLAILVPSAPALFTSGVPAFLALVVPGFAVLYGALLMVYFALRLTAPPSPFADFRCRVLLAIPIVGRLIRTSALVRFLRTFVCLYEAGVGVVESINLAAEAMDNVVMSREMRRAAPIVAAGGQLSEGFALNAFIPTVVAGMLATGEQSGHLDTTLGQAADYLQSEVDTTTDRIIQILPVVAFLLVAGFIAFTVVSFYMGYFKQITDATAG